jgi:hypothetical protein
LGFVSVTLDWTYGGIHINPFYVTLFGTAFSSGGPYGPVILGFSFPVGAIVFLLRRKKWTPAQSTPPSRGGGAGAAIRVSVFDGDPRKTFGQRGGA